MKYNPELPKVIRFEYRPQSGRLFVRCVFEEWAGREVEGTYGFQYQGQELSFMYPTKSEEYVLLPLGRAASIEDAVHMAEQFLKKWLSLDVKTHGRFQSEVTDKIAQLQERRRTASK